MSLDDGINGTEITQPLVQTTSKEIRKRSGLVALPAKSPPDDADIQALISMRNDVVTKQLDKRAEHERVIAEAQKSIETINKHLEMLGVMPPGPPIPASSTGETKDPVRDIDDLIPGAKGSMGPSARRFQRKHPNGSVEDLVIAAVNSTDKILSAKQVRRLIGPPKPHMPTVITTLSTLVRNGKIARVSPGKFQRLSVGAKTGSLPKRILSVFLSQTDGTEFRASGVLAVIAGPKPSKERVHMALASMASSGNSRIERVRPGVYRLKAKAT